MWLDRESEVDLLAYSPFAELITNIAANKRLNPLTIGLLGSWGVGKSTLLKLVEENIKKIDPSHKDIVCIPLNSWMFEGYDDAKSAIMESLLRALLDNQPAFKELKDKVNTLIGRIDFIRLGATVIKHGMPFAMSAINPAVATITAAQYLTEDKRKELVEDFKEIWKEKKDDNTTVENIRLFRKEFGELIDQSKIKNLVVMIDDLDRCTPERVIETLEAVKLFLSVPKTTFIIAVDTQVIKYSVEKKYPKISEDTIRFSDNYIEKIIQLPINIPELSEMDVKNYLLLLICELYLIKGDTADDKKTKEKNQLSILLNRVKEKSVFISGEKIDLDFIKSSYEKYDKTIFEDGKLDEFESIFNIISSTSEVISSTLKGNPRQAKRFLNTFLVRKSLAEIYYKADKSFDYSILAKLMALEYIDDKLFKELYKWTVGKNKTQAEINELKTLTDIAINNEEFPEEYRKWSDKNIIRWLKSDPVDLYKKDLPKYFYLTRESLDINLSISDSLTKAELEVFNKIVQGKRAVAFSKLIKDLKDNLNIKYTKVLDALIEKFQDEITMLDKIQYVYIDYPDYRVDIKDIIKKFKPSDIKPASITSLNGMYRVDSREFEDVVQTFRDKGVKEEVLEIICKNNEKDSYAATTAKR
ncbi:P-loop NTPase fold protein [Petroclostridium sp. X23]|uniref:KAP family P-loop NTPase fold protein n=1 Tax=Petroclostridium sp. X23 TaxID=3045146 RepID=UPI0024AD535C|nr:P-loop NTPase fold protein [Petroclostridium sp. X23]WHH59789.1 P-loop NTPase fold protein [Petroclostridium sp. X23]